MRYISFVLTLILIAGVCILPIFIGLFMLSHWSGWKTLTRYYRLSGDFMGTTWNFRKGAMNHVEYVVKIGANQMGLYISPMIIYRFQHPPLFIPWGEVTLSEQKEGFWTPQIIMRFDQTPDVYFRINKGLGDEMAEKAGGSWPEKHLLEDKGEG